MRRTDICLYLGPADRAELQALLTNRNTPRKLVWRADIVLATADGRGTVAIMRRTGMSKPTVWRWQERYLDEGVPGLKRDKTRPSRVPPLPREVRLKVIAKTVQETPPNATHWSRTTMAEAVGISPSSVGRIWADAGLKPHIVKGFKISNDPMFEEKVTDIVGLYLNPPDRAVVLCVDEKSQIQALDRTQPGLPLKKGRASTMTVSGRWPSPSNRLSDLRFHVRWRSVQEFRDGDYVGVSPGLRGGHKDQRTATLAGRDKGADRC
ncbi:IS630 family transposase [Yoonia vestfoldensis]|uniref:IS630 family transposase n=1 Tax=Yoonia vestfoldensis TaxID=245188 RepID=UPI00214FB831|nr:IS630 family transposase [Yoonia vestfoldensis]